jgi:hypothetical protein
VPESFRTRADTPQELFPQVVWDTAEMAGLATETMTPALCRTLMQWLEVLPTSVVVDALRQAHGSPHVLTAFREAAAEALRQQQVRQPPCRTSSTPTQKQPIGDLSEADRRALRAQFRLESLTEAEYQQELVRRLRS